ncbi:MAG TPA: hypothetical protein VFV96_04670 [Verrucomicrobiae bacterium]|nr:hypothetical protein [Verrucomicrobiae bacterium]
MNSILNKTVLVASLGILCALPVKAHLASPDGNLVVGSNDTDKSTSMDANLGLDVTTLWKWDKDETTPLQGGATFSGSGFTVVFSQDLKTATLSWNLTGLGTELYGVAWKDGTLVDGYSANLGYYWSAVTDGQHYVSDGDTVNLTIDLAPDFKNVTAWSHIAFYGTSSGGTTNVPDGGTTLALIGIAMTSLGLLRKKLS